jgi:hypothetical protein
MTPGSTTPIASSTMPNEAESATPSGQPERHARQASTPRVIQDFRPLHESAEWVLLRAYYAQAGVSAFTGGAVPFAATSDGTLAEDAAAILFASLEASATQGPVRCLEVGPGSGLFARRLLEELRRLCREHGREHYDRLTLVLADSSRGMLDDVASHAVLAEHEGRYELVHSDPDRPAQAAGGDPFHAVFLNYLLDALPASVVRRGHKGLEQLCVRTRLADDADLADYTALPFERVVELADAPAEAARERLADLHPALVLDVRYEPVRPETMPESQALQGILPDGSETSAVHGHGSIAALRGLVERLAVGGFILVNDFAHRPAGTGWEASNLYPTYGGAVAMGQNFPQIDREVARWPGAQVHRPPDSEARLVSRLIGRQLDVATVACYQQRADPFHRRAARAACQRAREAVAEGSPDVTRAALTDALSLAPRDWTLLEAAASFFAYVDRDHESARAMAERGLALNPLGVELWTVMGDVELRARRVGLALRCYERAITLDPRGVRARYSAAYALSARRDDAGALRMIADALALDDGSYSERLLAKQARILARVAQRKERDRKRQADRIHPWVADRREEHDRKLPSIA